MVDITQKVENVDIEGTCYECGRLIPAETNVHVCVAYNNGTVGIAYNTILNCCNRRDSGFVFEDLGDLSTSYAYYCSIDPDPVGGRKDATIVFNVKEDISCAK